MTSTSLTLPFISAPIDKAAEACGVGHTEIRRAIKLGDLVPRYTGARRSRPVLLATDLIDWLESLPTEPGVKSK